MDLFHQPPPAEVYDRNHTLTDERKAVLLHRNNSTMGKIHGYFESNYGTKISADRLAKVLGLKVHSVRSRFSELKAQGYLIETGESEKGFEGVDVAVCKKK